MGNAYSNSLGSTDAGAPFPALKVPGARAQTFRWFSPDELDAAGGAFVLLKARDGFFWRRRSSPFRCSVYYYTLPSIFFCS